MHLHILCIVALAACLVAAVPAHADRIDDLVKAQMARQHVPGLSLAVVRGGRLVKARGYGLANVEVKARATAQTVYQIQSVTKQFTATAVMMLVEEGKVGLDDAVSKYLDGTPETWRAVTVRHLLTHTSGIKDFINEPTASLRLDVGEEEVLAATAPRPLNFQPGERYAYSNTNYHLLAMIIRKVTGKSWGDFVHERICGPLEMRDTRVISLRDIIPNRASGYVWSNGRLSNGGYVAESILGYAGGGLRSTVLDMAKWDAALYTERLLRKASLEQMWTPAKLNNGSTAGYGFGWGIGDRNGHRVLSHTGAHMTGFSTVITRFPEDRLTVIILTNQTGASDPAALAQKVAGLYVPALASPEVRPIEDREPQVTALAKDVLRRTADGTLDPAVFTPEMRAEVYPDRIRQAGELLRSFGPLRSVELVERKDEGGGRVYRYRATYGKETTFWLLTMTGDGKISGLRLQGE